MPARDPSELEIALLIRASSPHAVAEQIAALPAIAGYRLLPQEPLRLRDLYVDTPQRVLSSKRVAFRLRTIDGAPWLTLKGPSRMTEWGGEERFELEDRWSPETLGRISEMLRRLASVHVAAAYQTEPLDALAAIGFVVVQDRETLRMPRDVVRGDAPERVLAELAVDSVVYRLEGRRIRLCDIEVGPKAFDGPRAVTAVTDALLATYGQALSRWRYGKLATGYAIARLLKDGTLDRFVERDGTLTPSACREIERSLAGGRL